MSAAGDRQALADAIGAVTGLTGYPFAPAAARPGDAWPLWRGAERDDDQLFVNRWEIVIVVPGDVDAASQFADVYGDQVADALVPELYVTAFRPSKYATESGDINALTVEGIRE